MSYQHDLIIERDEEIKLIGSIKTFLPGHFCGYSVKLNPLDGVYYCDVRPNMLTEDILKDHIQSLDHLLCKDIWKFI